MLLDKIILNNINKEIRNQKKEDYLKEVIPRKPLTFNNKIQILKKIRKDIIKKIYTYLTSKY